MPLGGFTCDELAAILGIAPQKATQAVDPAFIKVAKCMIANPVKTTWAIGQAMSRVLDEQAPQRNGAMTPAELEYRIRRQTGRLRKGERCP